MKTLAIARPAFSPQEATLLVVPPCLECERRTRLQIVKIHILDQIAALAKREHPYGRPGEAPRPLEIADSFGITLGGKAKAEVKVIDRLQTLKEIKKEGLSEYFLYTIEGTETIPTGWSKRMISFDIADVPVINLYKFEEERYGRSVVRFLSFKNDDEHKLGQTPIPGGMLKVYGNVDEVGHLSYAGQSQESYPLLFQEA